MKKRILAILTAIMLVMTGAALGEAAPAEVSGDFTGTAKGFGGDVTVTVTLTDGAITAVTAEGAGETEGVGSKAIELMPADMSESGSIAVDTVAGATITSNAILEAVKAALTAAGVDPEAYNVAVDKGAVEDQVRSCDVVIVGAGGAGMTAAITAADAGKSVVILESQAMVGGNSVRATGGMNASKTVWQDENTFAEEAGVEKTLASAAETYADDETVTALAQTVSEQWKAYQENPEGYFDSVELMELDTMIGGKAINDFDLVKTLCENSAAGIDWLDTIGAQLHDVASFGGASVKRIHRPVDAEGKTISVGSYIVPVLESACEERGIEILFNTTATALRQDENGNVTTGAYDLVPILEDFIKQHPDFSYRGARATLAVTGYDGVLGYRTNPNGEGYREEDREQAKAVADRLKELGYTFASNSWGYTSYASSSTERVKTDADRWEAEVAPIVGNTNILIFAGGADIAQNGEYSADNAKFSYLQSKGFTVFCPADNSQYSTAIGERYLRQGRRVIGGNALYYEGDKLQDLFHAIDVLDIARPADNTVT